MADSEQNVESIRENDIVFECPFCTKSLAIDYRGAGLTINCVDCGEEVEVPIPEGMDIVDLDSSAEEQEIRIVNLRRSLRAAESDVERLESENRQLRRENAGLTARVEQRPDDKLAAILRELDRIAGAQGDIAAAMERMRSLVSPRADSDLGS